MSMYVYKCMHVSVCIYRYAIKVIDIDVVMNKFMLGARAKGAVSTCRIYILYS